MTVGEFKKRLMESKVIYTQEDFSYSVEMDSSDVLILMLLEEARREFPSRHSSENEDFAHSFFLDEGEYDSNEVDEWFRRWFGK